MYYRRENFIYIENNCRVYSQSYDILFKKNPRAPTQGPWPIFWHNFPILQLFGPHIDENIELTGVFF